MLYAKKIENLGEELVEVCRENLNLLNRKHLSSNCIGNI